MEGSKSSARAEKVKSLGEKLDGYVAELAEQMKRGKSEMLIRYLEFAASFHTYSFGNLMLIFGQCPKATRVAGLRQWNRLGRWVRAGEQGIMIFAPMAVWTRADRVTEPASEAETIPSEENETRDRITLFRPVYVFDLSQTEGAPLPAIPIASGDVSRLLPVLRQVIEDTGIALEEKPLRDAAGISYGGRIALRQGLPDAEAFAVLVHEWSHELLHWQGERRGRKIEETEADMTAFIVCRHFGIECNSSDYLLTYKVTPELLLERLETVRATAARIIERVKEAMQEEVATPAGR